MSKRQVRLWLDHTALIYLMGLLQNLITHAQEKASEQQYRAGSGAAPASAATGTGRLTVAINGAVLTGFPSSVATFSPANVIATVLLKLPVKLGSFVSTMKPSTVTEATTLCFS